MTAFLIIYGTGAFWSGLAAATVVNSWRSSELAWFSFATLLWPLMWILVGIILVTGDE